MYMKLNINEEKKYIATILKHTNSIKKFLIRLFKFLFTNVHNSKMKRKERKLID